MGFKQEFCSTVKSVGRLTCTVCVIAGEKQAVYDSFTYGVFVDQIAQLDIPQLHLTSNDSGNPEIKYNNAQLKNMKTKCKGKVNTHHEQKTVC